MQRTEIQCTIHYPPITSEPANAIRAAHGDINLITLLMGAKEKVYKFKTWHWIDAIAEPDELVINVGDMLSHNNKLKSTIHQVVNPPRELWGTSRYSVPFFMHPVSDMPLNCLENCIDAENLNNLTILQLVITCTNA
jgi:isopenicillin N synthase-like dioxygenase